MTDTINVSNINTNITRTNHQIRDDEWLEYEKSLDKGSEDVLNSLATYVETILNGIKEEQKIYSSILTTFPEGFDEYRKLKNSNGIEKIAEIYGIKVDLTIRYDSEISKKKVEQMKLNNSKKNYQEILKSYENTIIETKQKLLKLSKQSKSSHQTEIFIPSFDCIDSIDIKILKLIYYMNTLIQMPISQINMSDAYETFLGVGKILQNIKTMNFKHHTTGKIMKIHPMIIKPLENKYNDLLNHIAFNYSTISTKYPKFFYSTRFDKFLPGLAFKPYESQKQILDFINENLSKPFLCVMNTLMGMGKTWVAGFIGYMIYKSNYKNANKINGKNDDKYIPKTFIYTCPEILKSVRQIVGRILHHYNVPFAIAFMKNGKVVIKKQNASKYSGEKPDVILSCVKASIELLKKDYIHENDKEIKKDPFILKKENIMMFYDENTIQMDIQNSPMIDYLAEIYQYLPPQTIFSSATHPYIEKMNNLKNLAEEKYPGIMFKTINCSKVLIGTQLNKLNGEMFIPHSKCVNTTTLEKFIKLAESDIMIQKFYTIPLVKAMYDRIVEIGLMLPNELKFDVWMSVLEHRNQESIQYLAIEYLKFIKEQGMIEKFNLIQNPNQSIDFDDLVKSSYNLTGQTFISCSNPLELLTEKFGKYFQKVMDTIGIKSFDDMYSKYKKQMTVREKIERSNAKAKTIKSDEKMSKFDREKEKDEVLMALEIPTIPEIYKLGSIKTSIQINYTNWDNIEAFDHVKFAALFGILIYSEESHHTYNDLIINMISNNMAIYVIADSTLNYGNSFPFNNGIITDGMSIHSDKTLFQLMARAGRPGISHTANIYASDSIIAKINDRIYNQNYIDIEYINISLCAKIALDKFHLKKQNLPKKEQVTKIFLSESNDDHYTNKIDDSTKLNKSLLKLY